MQYQRPSYRSYTHVICQACNRAGVGIGEAIMPVVGGHGRGANILRCGHLQEVGGVAGAVGTWDQLARRPL
jgi:hypothetical protein